MDATTFETALENVERAISRRFGTAGKPVHVKPPGNTLGPEAAKALLKKAGISLTPAKPAKPETPDPGAAVPAAAPAATPTPAAPAPAATATAKSATKAKGKGNAKKAKAAAADAQKLAAAVERGIEERFYSEDQPRDDRGRWGGGSAEGKAAEKAKGRDAHAAARLYHNHAANALEKKHGMSNAADAHRQAAIAHRNAENRDGIPSEARTASREAHSATLHSAGNTETRFPPGHPRSGQWKP